MLRIEVIRRKESYKPKRHPEKADAWDNNDANNSLDDFIVYRDDIQIFQCKAQTVSNMPGGRPGDTVAPGPFQIRTFVDQRSFWPRIHGICNTTDMEGQEIDSRSIEPVRGNRGEPIDINRWLVHDWQKLKPNMKGIDTRVAWSLCCFVLKTADLWEFNNLLDRLQVTPGTIIQGNLLEEP